MRTLFARSPDRRTEPSDATSLSAGRILSWGAFSAGALGLGHPELPNTPLSPKPPADSADTAGRAAQVAPPAPAGLMQRAQAFLPPMPAVPPQLAGLLPGGLIGGPGPVVGARPRRVDAPDRVDKPTQVEFDTQLTSERKRNKKEPFVYSITAAGWHSACLAVELDDSASLAASVIPGGTEREEGEGEEPVIDFHLARTAADHMTRNYLLRRADRDERPRTNATDATDELNGMTARVEQMRFDLAPTGAPSNPFGPTAPDARQ